jgi:hypothetical protein
MKKGRREDDRRIKKKRFVSTRTELVVIHVKSKRGRGEWERERETDLTAMKDDKDDREDETR